MNYFSQLYDIFYHNTMLLLEGGIIQHWMDETKELMNPKYYQKPLLMTKEYLHEIYPKTHPEGPQILTLDHLEAGFVVYLAAMAICVFVFICEWTWCRVKSTILNSMY